MEEGFLDTLFGEAKDDVAMAEEKVMEFVNGIKYVVNDNEQHENGAEEDAA